MHEKTEKTLKDAFAGESQAHVTYLAFADSAEREGYGNVARLFRAASYAEQVHATSHLRTVGGIGKTSDNLEKAIGGETYEVEEMYPDFKAVAEEAGENAAFVSHDRAMEAEKIHAALYTRAKAAVDGGQDVEMGQFHVCSVCGWTGEGEPPDECPLCNAKKDKFKLF
jgi:rubrerythrin